MASKVICAVWDNSAQCFGTPGTYPAVGMATRMFTDEVNRVAEDNVLNRHPEDFQLWQLAVFDDVTGEFENAKSKLVDAITCFIKKV